MTTDPEKLAQIISEEAQKGNLSRAEQLCLAALNDHVSASILWRTLGAIRHHRKDTVGAIQAFNRLVALDPDDAEGWASLGLVLGINEQAEDAVNALKAAFTLNPDLHAAGRNLGLSLMRLKRPTEAVPVYENLVQRFPQEAGLFIWLGHAKAAARDPDGAKEAYETALSLDPTDRNARLTLALVERDLGNIDQSTALMSALLSENPDQPVVAFARAQNQLLLGNFEEGFAGLEARWNRPGIVKPDLPMPWWSEGTDIAGKHVLVFDEQGLGDTIQFCRFVPELLALGARVTFSVRPRLARLLSTLSDRITIVDTADDVQADFCIPLMSVPHLLRTTSGSIPAATPYLQPEVDRLDHWHSVIKAKQGQAQKTVGLIWQGNPDADTDVGRSFGPEILLPLIDLKDHHFFILQTHVGREAVTSLSDHEHVTDLGEILDRDGHAFLDTAAVMSCLDHIVTSDTGPAHLAGALNRPTSLLLKSVPEWRWGLQGDTSPWYPSFTLFRQQDRGDWSGPITQLAQSLKNL